MMEPGHDNDAPQVRTGEAERRPGRWRRAWRNFLIVIGSILGLALIAAGIWFWNNMNYDRGDARALEQAGFVEKQFQLPDGTVLNYGEGPVNGPPLLLIHGQQSMWQSYVSVLPDLAGHFHVFAVDKHGHGASSKDPEKYTAQAMGADLAVFIEEVIGEPVMLSGHSSGALLSVWLAANEPELVERAVLEDPPLFSTEPDRREDTFAWRDSFRNIHGFLNQDEETDYARYYLEHTELRGMFGDSWDFIQAFGNGYLNRNPGSPLRIFFLPPSLNRAFGLLDGPYDLRFGDTFYDGSWFDGFDQAETLARVQAPTVLIHASWQYTEEGLLLAAMDGNDAARANSLLPVSRLVNIESGHDVHTEKPDEFVQVLLEHFR